MSHDSDEGCSGEPNFVLKEEVRQGILAAIREALKCGKENYFGQHVDGAILANECDDDGYTLLHWAVGMTDDDGREETGANKYGRKISARRSIVCLLLDHGAKAWPRWWQEGFCTTSSGHHPWDLTEDTPTTDVVQKACIEQFCDAVKKGEDREHGLKASALCAAASLQNIDALRKALKEGACPNEDSCDYSPLSIAAGKGNLECVKTLVEEFSANINHDVDQNGATALDCAMSSGKNAVVQYLIDAGANVFLRRVFAGTTLLFCRHPDTIKLVLGAMMDQIPAMLTRHKSTCRYKVEIAFEVFTSFGCIEGLQVLVQNDADFPKDVLQRGVAFGQKDALEYLIAHGALRSYSPTAEKVHWYGRPRRECPSKELVRECQAILDDVILAREEWERLASSDGPS